MPEAWIIDAVRSPRGRGKPGVGSLSNTHPQRCMAQVLNGLKDKVGFDPADIEDVIAGCGNGSGDHAHDIARMSVLDAGWPITTTGVTLHRFCGSGQQAVTFAAMGVMLLLTGFVLEFAGFIPNQEQTMEVKLAMVSLYGLLPLVCYIAGAVLFSRFKLDEAAHKEIRAALDARALDR